MGQPTQDQVTAALRHVRDPEQNTDIVTSGMISGLVIKDGSVSFAIEVDPSRGPELEPLRQDAERVVRNLPGVSSVRAVLTAQRPAIATSGRTPSTAAAAGRPGRGAVPGIHAIVAVASGKGGVGKSTTAVNLAVALAANGQRIGLLDADIYGPSAPRMMGLTGRPEVTERKTLRPLANYGVKVMSMGFLVAEDTPTIWRGPMVQGALLQMLREVDWGGLDVLVVDLPPGTGDIHLSLAQQVPMAGAVIVSTPQDIALIDAKKALAMFRRVEVPVLGIIENMSYFCCPNCGHRTDVFSHGGARREAERLGVPFLGEVPLDIEIRETSDGGRPVVVSNPGGAHAQSYRSIAAAVWAHVGGGPIRPPPRIVIE